MIRDLLAGADCGVVEPAQGSAPFDPGDASESSPFPRAGRLGQLMGDEVGRGLDGRGTTGPGEQTGQSPRARQSAPTFVMLAGFVLGGLLLARPSWADEDPPEDPQSGEAPAPDDTLSKHRAPIDVLTERTIGTASRPVAFNWRRTKVHVAGMGSHLFELNNFNSLRSGAMVRFPANNLMFEIGLSYVWVWDTPSSRLLAYTPYRQPGRPPRLELDVLVGLPVAEGLVTTSPRFFPAVELVFNLYGGWRYISYPTAYRGMRTSEVAGAVLSPTLTEDEVVNLDDLRLDAMQVDLGRYGLMAGFGNDIYFSSGFFVSPRLLLAVPLLAPASQTDLTFWADLSVCIGLAL